MQATKQPARQNLASFSPTTTLPVALLPEGHTPPQRQNLKIFFPVPPANKKWVKLDRDFHYSDVLVEGLHCLLRRDGYSESPFEKLLGNILAEWRGTLVAPPMSPLPRRGSGGGGGIIRGQPPSFLPLTGPGLRPGRPLPPGERRVFHSAKVLHFWEGFRPSEPPLAGATRSIRPVRVFIPHAPPQLKLFYQQSKRGVAELGQSVRGVSPHPAFPECFAWDLEYTPFGGTRRGILTPNGAKVLPIGRVNDYV